MTAIVPVPCAMRNHWDEKFRMARSREEREDFALLAMVRGSRESVAVIEAGPSLTYPGGR